MRGPLVVVVDARAWSDYAGGVFAGGNATHPALDHLVQLVTAPPLGHVHAPRPTTRASRPPRSRSWCCLALAPTAPQCSANAPARAGTSPVSALSLRGA